MGTEPNQRGKKVKGGGSSSKSVKVKVEELEETAPFVETKVRKRGRASSVDTTAPPSLASSKRARRGRGAVKSEPEVVEMTSARNRASRVTKSRSRGTKDSR